MKNYSLKDIMAQSIISLDFPAQFLATLSDSTLKNVTISQFYIAFCKKNNLEIIEGKNVLFTPALLLGFLFTTFLLPKEAFFENLPDDPIKPDDWGLKIEKGNNFSLKYITRRMRNALAHNNINITDQFEFSFWDSKTKNPEKSSAEVIYGFSFDDLMFKFIPNWQKIITERFSS